jgi:hypothetical protein
MSRGFVGGFFHCDKRNLTVVIFFFVMQIIRNQVVVANVKEEFEDTKGITRIRK